MTAIDTHGHTPLQIIARWAGLEPAEVQPNLTLEDIGLDSLSLMEIALTVQRAHGVVIPEGELYAEQTVAAAIARIDEAIGGPSGQAGAR